MNFYLILMSMVMTVVLAKCSNETPAYIAVILIIIAFVPAIIAIIRSEKRDMELEERIKQLENKENDNESR